MEFFRAFFRAFFQVFFQVFFRAFFRASSSQPKDEVRPPASLRQLNDNLYEVFKPHGRPTVELVFFHGLQRDITMQHPHISTWLSGGERPEMWLQWLDEKFEGIRVLTVTYDAALEKTDVQGNLDIFRISENLLHNLTHHKDGVGQDGCPVVLVGHSVGCLVIKNVLLQAESEAKNEFEGAGQFLGNVRGIFYFSGPHNGANLRRYRQRGLLVDYLAILNEQAARDNQRFEALRRRREFKWKTAGVTESLKTRMGVFNNIIVTEASARHGVDGLLYTVPADHFDVCRPENKTSSSFRKLCEFIEAFLREDRHRQIPKTNLLRYAPGLGPVVDSIIHLLETGNRRVAIVGMGGCGKTTAASELFDRLGARFDYTCFVDDVKTKMGLEKNDKNIHKILEGGLMYRGRKVKVDEKEFDWSLLQRKRGLIVLDDVDRIEHVRFLNGENQFLRESWLLTTSREKHSFLGEHDFKIEEMLPLKSADAEELLMSHAFNRIQEVERREIVARPLIQRWVKDLAAKCGNLPLALGAVGRRLAMEGGTLDENLWRAVYKKIQAAESPDGDRRRSIWNILAWSVDDLEDEEKEMFLDVATIFHGRTLESARAMWAACFGSWELVWKNLKNKSLVSLDTYGRFINMHELYRDLGRKMAGLNSADVVTHTRVFEEDKFKQLLTKEHNDAAVKVLIYKMEWFLSSKPRLDMRRWTNLRVIQEKRPFGRASDMFFPTSLRFANVGAIGPETIKRIFEMTSLRHISLGAAAAFQRLPGSLCQLTELKHLKIWQARGLFPTPWRN